MTNAGLATEKDNEEPLAETVRRPNMLRPMPLATGGLLRPVVVAVRLAAREKRLAALLAVFIVLEAASGGAVIYFIKEFLSQLVSSQSLRSVAFGAGLLLVLWLIRAGSSFGNKVYRYTLGRAIERDARIDVLAHMMKLSVGFIESHRRAELIQQVSYDTTALRDSLTAFASAVSSAARVLGLMVVAYLMDPFLALLGLAAMPLGLPVLVILGRKLEASARRQRKAAVKLVDLLVELMNGIRTIKAFNGEPREEAFHREACEEIYENTARTQVWQAAAIAVPELALGIGLVVVVVVGGARLIGGELEWPALLGFMMAVLAIQSPFGGLIDSLASLRARQPYADRYFDLLAVEPQVEDPASPRPIPSGPPSIEFRDVSYEAAGEPILDGVSLRIEAGETVGIVGPTGAGKTTLLNLTARFIDPSNGVILHNGIDIRSVKQRDLMSTLAIVTQDAFLFATDIATNISYGRPRSSLEEIRSVARAAGILDEIDTMPDGLATKVGLGGRPVSGGQAQRINIARALLKGAPLLLLDEATSALDSETEVRVQKAIERDLGQRGRTTLMIAHRISTLRSADRILVLEGGRVVGFAPHTELMETNPVYRRLVESQSVAVENRERTQVAADS